MCSRVIPPARFHRSRRSMCEPYQGHCDLASGFARVCSWMRGSLPLCNIFVRVAASKMTEKPALSWDSSISSFSFSPPAIHVLLFQVRNRFKPDFFFPCSSGCFAYPPFISQSLARVHAISPGCYKPFKLFSVIFSKYIGFAFTRIFPTLFMGKYFTKHLWKTSIQCKIKGRFTIGNEKWFSRSNLF